jgi:hypothetical protein
LGGAASNVAGLRLGYKSKPDFVELLQ